MEVGRQGKPAQASNLNDDGEAAYVKRLVQALRKRKDSHMPMSLSMVTDPNVHESSPLPEALRVRYSNLRGLLAYHKETFILHNEPSINPLNWYVSLREDGDGDEDHRQLAYLRLAASLLSATSWCKGGALGLQCPLPKHLKTEGVTFKQLVLKYPNIVEMRFNEGNDVSYRRGNWELPTGSRARLVDPHAQPANPNPLLPGEPRYGDWTCERKGCGKVNFLRFKKCTNLECDGTRPSRSTTSSSPSSSSSSSSSTSASSSASLSSPLPPAYTPRDEDPGAPPTEYIDEAAYQFAEDAFVGRVATGLQEGWVRLDPLTSFLLLLALLRILHSFAPM